MKKVIVLLLCLFLISGCGERVKKTQTQTKEIVATTEDRIGDNGLWCATFQLIWNDLKNEYVKKDIEIDNDVARNLNKESFKESEISESYYYKKYGYATPELKSEIEQSLKEKFNQESEILDEFSWDGSLIFYTMLYREFEFEKKFDVLSNNDFGKYKNIKYFGISPDSKKELKNQIKILFYENNQNFAISIKTKSNDEVIMYKNPSGETFDEIYKNMTSKEKNYEGEIYMGDNDEFKAPMLSLNYKREYDELENKAFKTYEGEELYIYKAIQTIQFDLDEKGGKIKSEAGMGVKNTAFHKPSEPKKLYLNDTFALFLKEESKEKPYFGAKITDITKFQ